MLIWMVRRKVNSGITACGFSIDTYVNVVVVVSMYRNVQIIYCVIFLCRHFELKVIVIVSDLILVFKSLRPGFDTTSVHVEFVVDKVALGQVSLPALQFPLSVSFHQCSILIHLPPTLYNVFLPSSLVSPVSIIPPMLHAHLCCWFDVILLVRLFCFCHI